MGQDIFLSFLSFCLLLTTFCPPKTKFCFFVNKINKVLSFVNFVPSGTNGTKTYFLLFLLFYNFVILIISMTFDKYDKLGCADTAWPVFSPGRILQRGETRDTSPWHSGVSIPYLADGNQDCFGKCTSRVFTHGSTSRARGKRKYLEVETCGTQ